MKTSGSGYFGLLTTCPLFFLLAFFTPNSTPLVAAAEQLPQAITGQVVETINAAGYTYVRLSHDDTTQTWIALPETTLATGTELSVVPEMKMTDFHSKTLSKTFPVLFFAGQVQPETEASPAPAVAQQSGSESAEDSFAAAIAAEQNNGSSPAQPIEAAQQSGGSIGAIVPFNEISITKAPGPNSYTVGELFDNAEQLAGQNVRVRGQVVKFNANIMGRNWLHLQDGSGDPLTNTHDLVATTNETVEQPAVITIEGVLSADQDFGAGYTYPVIIEKSRIVERE